MSYYITVEIYDKNANYIDSFNFCRYFKVTKNSLIDIDVPFYNQYQFLIEMPKEKKDLIDSSNIYRLKIFDGKDLKYSVYINPTDIQVIKETQTTILFNVIGMGYNIYRFMTEELLSRISDYDQFFKIFNQPRTSFSTSFFSLLTDGMFKLMNIVYGPFMIDANMSDTLTNSTTLTIQNLPLMNNLDVLKFFFKNFQPVLDYPFLAIDDLIELKDERTTGTIILNSYHNLNYFKKNLILDIKMIRYVGMSMIQEIPSNNINKFAYGDYVFYDVDHYTTNPGPFFSMPRVFGTSLNTEELKSIYTVKLDYPIDQIDLNALRNNYQDLCSKNLTTYLFKFVNTDSQFLEINKIMNVNGNQFYIYGNEFEFNPINIKSNTTIFKLDGTIKTLNITK